MEISVKHVYREAVYECEWKHDSIRWYMGKFNGLYSNITNRIRLPAKRRKQIIFENITWEYYLYLTVESKGYSLVKSNLLMCHNP